MEERHRQTELSQFYKLCAISAHFDDNVWRESPITYDDELEILGVERGPELDIDNDPIPGDPMPLFFRARSHDEASAKKDRDQLSDNWEASLILPDGKRQMVPARAYPGMRAACFENVRDLKDNIEFDHYNHPWVEQIPRWGYRMREYNTPAEMEYVSHTPNFPKDKTKPHATLVMCDSERAPEKTMLVSELVAAAALVKHQVRFGMFVNHHTKPVLIYSFQWETHARITQAYMDPNTNKLIIRQSRLLDVSGEHPPPDAYILLRWMMNTPTGETEYRGDKAKVEIEAKVKGKAKEESKVKEESTAKVEMVSRHKRVNKLPVVPLKPRWKN